MRSRGAWQPGPTRAGPGRHEPRPRNVFAGIARGAHALPAIAGVAASRLPSSRRQDMRSGFRAALRTLLPALALLAVASQAQANTLNQNVSWTIDRAGTSTKYRIVAYGDSIYAGYNGSVFNAAKYAAPTVDAEYLSALW